MTNNKKKLILGIGSIVLVLVLAGAGVFAWYMNLTSNLIDPQTLQVTTSQFLEVRQAAAPGEEENDFGHSLELSFEDLVLVDITGDGTTLVRPRLLQNADEVTGLTYAAPDTSTVSEWTDPEPNKDYIDVTLEFRSNKHLDVYLGSGSAVTPHCGVENAMNPGEDDNPSNYGSFSRDLMAGAVRVAFVTADEQQTSMVWEPNRQYKLYYYAGNEEGEGRGWFFDMNSNDFELTHYYYYVAGSGHKVQSSLEAQNIPVVYDSSLEMNTAAVSCPTGEGANAHIVTLEYNPETGFYEGSAVLRIWIEGCDRETRRAIAGGAVDVALYLYGYELAGN